MEDKTDRIMQAVRGVLAEKGYQGATISETAAAAGISRGLLHYYFKNKEDMLCRVIRHSTERITAQTQAIFEEACSLEEVAGKLCGALRSLLETDPHFFKLFLEAWVFARRGPEAGGLLKDIHEQFRNSVNRGLVTFARKSGRTVNGDFSALAVILTSLVDGIGMQVTIEPSLLSDETLWASTEKSILVLLESRMWLEP